MKLENELSRSGLMLEPGDAVAELVQLHHLLSLEQGRVAVLRLFPAFLGPRGLILESFDQSLLPGPQALKGSPQSPDLGFESLLEVLLVDRLEEVGVGVGDVAGGS